MAEDMRKKSPRAPSVPLPDAIERAFRVYDKERRHAVPVDIVAQDIGYKSANNGAALSTLASLRYFGLLDRLPGGKLSVTKEVEDYRFTPANDLKQQIQLKWLRSPPIFADLLDKFQDGLPSDAVLRFELIQRGFTPSAAESALDTFKRSVEFVNPFQQREDLRNSESRDAGSNRLDQDQPEQSREVGQQGLAEPKPLVDRIPIRLSGGRRAFLEIPDPFFSADKDRIKAQVDLLLAQDEDEGG